MIGAIKSSAIRCSRTDSMDRAGRATKVFATMIGATKLSAVRCSRMGNMGRVGRATKVLATMTGATKLSGVRCSRADRTTKANAMTTGATKSSAIREQAQWEERVMRGLIGEMMRGGEDPEILSPVRIKLDMSS